MSQQINTKKTEQPWWYWDDKHIPNQIIRDIKREIHGTEDDVKKVCYFFLHAIYVHCIQIQITF